MKKQILLYFKATLLLFNSLYSNPERTTSEYLIKHTYPVSSEQERSYAVNHIEQALSGGASVEDKSIIEKIQKRALEGGYTTEHPIFVTFHGFNKFGKTTLTKQLLSFFGNKGVLLSIFNTNYSFRTFVDEEIKKPILENESYTFILDELDDFGNNKSPDEINYLVEWINEAKKINIESNRQRYFFFGTTNHLFPEVSPANTFHAPEVSPNIRNLSINIKLNYPNFAARLFTLKEYIESDTANGYMRVNLSDKHLEAAAQKMKGFGYFDIQHVVSKAAANATGEFLQGRSPDYVPPDELKKTTLKRNHLMKAVEYQRPHALLHFKIDQDCWKIRLRNWLQYDLRFFLCEDIPNFGGCLIAKIIAYSGIKKFSGLSKFWPFSLYLKKKLL